MIILPGDTFAQYEAALKKREIAPSRHHLHSEQDYQGSSQPAGFLRVMINTFLLLFKTVVNIIWHASKAKKDFRRP